MIESIDGQPVFTGDTYMPNLPKDPDVVSTCVVVRNQEKIELKLTIRGGRERIHSETLMHGVSHQAEIAPRINAKHAILKESNPATLVLIDPRMSALIRGPISLLPLAKKAMAAFLAAVIL